MKYNIQKKGVSAVVATVLIIMITVAAVGIIWAAIVPMIQDSLVAGTICNDAVSDISIGVTGYTCINGSDILLQIKKGPNENVKLVAVNAIVATEGNSKAVRINLTNDFIVDEETGENSGRSGDLPGNNEEQIITLKGDYKDATGVSIAPIVQVGNTEKICSSTGQVTLVACK